MTDPLRAALAEAMADTRDEREQMTHASPVLAAASDHDKGLIETGILLAHPAMRKVAAVVEEAAEHVDERAHPVDCRHPLCAAVDALREVTP